MSSDTTPTTNRAPDFTATVGGTARIGPNRELKRAIEGYWKGTTDRASLEAVAASLRGDTARSLRDAGFDMDLDGDSDLIVENGWIENLTIDRNNTNEWSWYR